MFSKMLWGIAIAILLAGHQASAVAEGVNGLRQLRQSGAFMIQLQRQEHGRPSTRRHLLRSGVLPVQGAVREVGYFYTTLTLGTPARSFIVIIDTGSTITYVPCKGCAHCGKHQDEAFDPDASSTVKKLTCGEPLCNCGTPSCSCKEGRCYYQRNYAEGSSSQGWLIEDAFGFPDQQPPVRMVFGCENGESGEIYKQMADGLMGMGNSRNAFHSQLVDRGVIEDVFSLCFGYPKDGVLLLGDVTMPEGTQTLYTPLLNNLHMHYYNIKMEGVTVDGKQLPLDQNMFDRGYGVVLDSGTTFTYLPSAAFRAMSKAIGDYAEAHGLQRTPGADPQYNDICWKGAADAFQGLEAFFPPAEFVLGGGMRLSLPPLRYLFLSRPAEYCLGFFDNGMSGTLIGGISVRDVVVTYDRRNSRVGFTAMACADVSRALATRTAGGPAGSGFTNATGIPASPLLPASADVTPSPTASPTAAPSTADGAFVARTSPPFQLVSTPPPPPPAETGAGPSAGNASLQPAGTSGAPDTGPPYHAPVLDDVGGNNVGMVAVVVVLVVIGVILVVEIFVFKRSKLSVWLRQRVSGPQDETELAPLAGSKGIEQRQSKV